MAEKKEAASVTEMVQDTIDWLDSLTPYDDDIDLQKEKREVLPTNITPKHYFISYSSIDLTSKFTFNGTVEIDLIINQQSNEIKINSCDIEYKSISVTQADNTQNIDIANIDYDEKTEQATIPLDSTLETGAAKLTIGFAGNLNDKMKGFYRSKYKLSDGSDGYCGTTQFEATDARRAFPCWDEPLIKATFSLEITCPKSLAVLSNMPIINSMILDDNNSLKTVLFDKTPIMSTYLLAWIIGEFESIESKTKRDILVRVWTTIGNKSSAQFACDVACRCLDFYENYFEIEYPLPKCDMIAVPDFAAGAMENWGLITYREVALLCDAQTASLKAKQYVCIVVCHELAHQWFGNLVTMEWWSQLWLNEGFACFMEYLSSDALYPKWNMWNLFLLSEYSRAFELDGMITSHPIETNVLTAAQAEEVFDTISYCKGACVIRMLESFLGKEVFRLAIKKYLNKFKYSNAVTTDLWNELSKESKKSIELIMQNWTRKQGFPLINASLDEVNKKLVLNQERFLISGKDEENTVWNVPMNIKVNGKIMKVLFDAKEKAFDIGITDIKDLQYIHINAESNGFYCCNYDDKLIGLLNTNSKGLSVIDKICLIRDTKALAIKGIKGATEQLLDIVVSFQNEVSYPIWNELLSAMADIVHIIDGNKEIMANINGIMVNALGNIYDKLGFDAIESKQGGDDDDDEKKSGGGGDGMENDETINGLFRPLIIGAMAKYKNKKVIGEIMNRFNLFMSDDNKYDEKNENILPSEIRSIVFTNVIKNGNEKEFELLKGYYLYLCENKLNAMEQAYSLRALGCIGCNDSFGKDKIESFLKWIMLSDQVRSQDKVFPFRVLSHSGINGRNISWQFLKNNWDKWFKLFEGGFLVQHLAKIPSGFVDLDKAKEIEDFYNSIDVPVCKRAMDQCIENITQNANWRNREIENIKKWAQINDK